METPGRGRAIREPREELDEDGAEVRRRPGPGSLRWLTTDREPERRHIHHRRVRSIELGPRKGGGDGHLDRSPELARRLDLPTGAAANPPDRETELWPAAGPGRHTASTSRMERRDQPHRAVLIGGRCRVESQRPVQPLANGRAVVRALPEEHDDAWSDGDRRRDGETGDANWERDRNEGEERAEHVRRSWRASWCSGGWQDEERVDRFARGVDLEMEVWPGRVAGQTDRADDLAGRHRLTDPDTES